MFNDDGLGAAMAQSRIENLSVDALEKTKMLEKRVMDLEAQVAYLMRREAELTHRFNLAAGM